MTDYRIVRLQVQRGPVKVGKASVRVFFSPVTGEHFDFAEGAHDPVKRLSRQPMR